MSVRAAGLPRWVKVAGIVTVVLAALLVVMLLTGGHGPGRHAPSPAVTGGGHAPPAGGHG